MGWKNDQWHPEVALSRCFVCGEDSEVLLSKSPRGDKRVKEADGKCIDKRPCPKCEGYMKEGIIVISVDEEKSQDDRENPWRTGGWWVIKAEPLLEVLRNHGVAEELLADIGKRRVTFMPDQICDLLGLVKGEGGLTT